MENRKNADGQRNYYIILLPYYQVIESSKLRILYRQRTTIKMGKDRGFMTAKAISKRIKEKGLGRLRWYCQMCEKQCRDENGFKCHTNSSGHQRQLELFSEIPSEYVTKFSLIFRREFLSILCQRYGTNLISANTVYQEYIKDKEHIHMNATRWTTLTVFC